MDDEQVVENSSSLQGINRNTVLEHPLLAPKLDELDEKTRVANRTLLNTLENFVTDTSDCCGDKNFIIKGRVRWQAALFDGMQEARAKAWEKKARKQDRERVKEMAREWILRQPPWCSSGKYVW